MSDRIPRLPKGPSKGEAELELWLRSAPHIPKAEREYAFHAVRKWRLDFAWPLQKFAVEIEGIVWDSTKKGRHQTGPGMYNDLLKYHAAHMMGWRIYRCAPQMITAGQALEAIEFALLPGRIRSGLRRPTV